jgi:hypothetical protein
MAKINRTPGKAAEGKMKRSVQEKAISLFQEVANKEYDGEKPNPEQFLKDILALWEKVFPGKKWPPGMIPLPDVHILIARIYQCRGEMVLAFKNVVKGCFTEKNRGRKFVARMDNMCGVLGEILESKEQHIKLGEEVGLKEYHLKLLHTCYLNGTATLALNTCGNTHYTKALGRLVKETDAERHWNSHAEFDAPNIMKQAADAHLKLLKWAGVKPSKSSYKVGGVTADDCGTTKLKISWPATAEAIKVVAASLTSSTETTIIDGAQATKVPEASAVDGVKSTVIDGVKNCVESSEVDEAGATSSVETSIFIDGAETNEVTEASIVDGVGTAELIEAATTSIETSAVDNTITSATEIVEASIIDSVEVNTTDTVELIVVRVVERVVEATEVVIASTTSDVETSEGVGTAQVIEDNVTGIVETSMIDSVETSPIGTAETGVVHIVKAVEPVEDIEAIETVVRGIAEIGIMDSVEANTTGNVGPSVVHSIEPVEDIEASNTSLVETSGIRGVQAVEAIEAVVSGIAEIGIMDSIEANTTGTVGPSVVHAVEPVEAIEASIPISIETSPTEIVEASSTGSPEATKAAE